MYKDGLYKSKKLGMNKCKHLKWLD